jgi:hypothetical protein
MCFHVSVFMTQMMEHSMTEKQKSPSQIKERTAAMTATARANEMLRDVCGPRGWNDTRESWLARGARIIGMSPRRARALFYQEPIRLSADEYIAIQQAYEAAQQSMETLSDLARHADVSAHRISGVRGK